VHRNATVQLVDDHPADRSGWSGVDPHGQNDPVRVRQLIQETIEAVGRLHGIEAHEWSFETVRRDVGDRTFQIAICWGYGGAAECLTASIRAPRPGCSAHLNTVSALRRFLSIWNPDLTVSMAMSACANGIASSAHP
jgi:hypothetical protein